ncbi:MAG: radical SAM protein [Clostridia bacterium]|nr:radical SAM protein [Clostridia bacterium]
MITYEKCRLCGHNCGIDRTKRHGKCHIDATPRIARADLHLWEEPPITGKNGSGTIFFSGCSLGCIYCQNHKISRGAYGRKVSDDELVRLMLSLAERGATNINFVTPTHFIPTLARVIPEAKRQGLTLPVVYNTSSYERVESLRMLDGLIDIYLPDLKYMDSRLALRYSGAEDYPEVAMAAIDEMMRQCPTPVLSDTPAPSPASEENEPTPVLLRGVLCRVLVLPRAVANACLAVSHLYRKYGERIYISLLGQYTPMAGMPPPLNRRITAGEYRRVVEYTQKLGVTKAFVQSLDVADESFIPDFYEEISM